MQKKINFHRDYEKVNWYRDDMLIILYQVKVIEFFSIFLKIDANSGTHRILTYDLITSPWPTENNSVAH